MDILSLHLLACLLALTVGDKLEIYNTKLATSDLHWDKYPIRESGGWEEVSSYDKGRRGTIRSYQVCDDEIKNVDNWIRSPYIESRGGKEVHLEVEFSINRCDVGDPNKKSTCKETFNIFYYEADSDIASSTFPPWQENPFRKVDTVAANVEGLNKRLFSFGPVERNGFYIAIQDQGACMSISSLSAFYNYCPETSVNLVVYPRTVSKAGKASLVEAVGKCTANSQLSGSESPLYRCNSDGEWHIPTGECVCDAGYQSNHLNTDCFACPTSTYKLGVGPGRCAPCPTNSGSSTTSTFDVINQCPCLPGYARAPGEDASVPCSGPPSPPTSFTVVSSNATSALLRWMAPVSKGGRKDVFFKFTCKNSLVTGQPQWKACPETMRYLAPSHGGKFRRKSLKMAQLQPYRRYHFTVVALNAAFPSLSAQSKNSSAAFVTFQTNESAPSSVVEVKATRRTANEIVLVWGEPLHANGVIRSYEVQLDPESDQDPRPNEDPDKSRIIVNLTSVKTISVDGLSEDTRYKVRVRAKTSAGFGPYSKKVSVKTLPGSGSSSERGSSPNSILVILAVALLLFAALFILFFRYKKTGKLLCLKTTRRKEKHPQHPNGSAPQDHPLRERLIVDLPPPGHPLYVDYPDPHSAIAELGCEINPETIQTEEIIGEGEFAEVYRGRMAKGSRTYVEVAVKKLKMGASSKDQSNFLREASTMAQFNHPNVIQLKGTITQSEPVMIVTEYMRNKSLDRFLQLNREKLTIIQLVEMLRGIASGMRYLSIMKYIHRDLAARNILVDSDLVCKVSDFGLSRTLQNNPHATYTTQGGKIAIRWTALESILYRKFTSASDVWSYGIVTWEVMSYGEKPYWDMNNEDVVKNVQSGMRLPAPEGCPGVLHEMMLNCWLTEPQARPTFFDLTDKLEAFLRQPSLLLPDVSHQTTTCSNQPLPTLEISDLGADDHTGAVVSVENWLEMQKLSKYSGQFKQRGIDSLEKVSDLTLNDLKSMGIDVTLHINTLESGIKTLKRHLSSSASSPPTPRRSSPSTSGRILNGNIPTSKVPPGSVEV